MQKVEYQGLVGFRFEHFAEPTALRHIFGARNSQDAGNLAFSGGRNREAALAVRKTWSAYLQVPETQWVVGGQTHSATVQVVGEAQRSRGALAPTEVLPDTDGLFTTCSGLPLYVAAADCSAVLLHAPGALAVVHGGWRGLAQGIMKVAVERFLEHGYEATDLQAGVLPCIAAASYEVGPEVAQACPTSAKYQGRDDRWQVDIAKWAAAELIQAGVTEDKLMMSGMDTGSDAQLFSHRRQGVGAGRNGLIAVLA